MKSILAVSESMTDLIEAIQDYRYPGRFKFTIGSASPGEWVSELSKCQCVHDLIYRLFAAEKHINTVAREQRI